MYVQGAQIIPPVLPNTGAGEVFVAVGLITVAVAALVVVSAVARQLAKKAYNA